MKREQKKKQEVTLKSLDKRLGGVDRRLDSVDKRLDGVDEKLVQIDKRFDGMDKRMDSGFAYLITRQDEFEQWVKENMFTKKEFFEWAHRFEDSLIEIRDIRQNRLLFEKQFVDLDDKVAQHENRITTLEMKHV